MFLTSAIPAEIRTQLPTIEELEKDLNEKIERKKR